MKRLTTMMGLFIVLFTSTVFAGFGVKNSSNVDLGFVGYIKCSTGLTCTKSGQYLNVVSSPSLVGPLTLESGALLSNPSSYDVTVSSSSDTSLSVLGYEAKSAILNLWADQGDDTADKFSLASSADNTLAIRSNAVNKIVISTGGNFTGVGTNNLSGFLQAQVASTTVAITAAQCGSTFVSNSIDVMTLPEASTVLGCRLTFISGTADDFDINPADATDVIGPISVATAIAPSAGDAIRITDVGSAVVLEAVGADLWAVVSSNGAVTDVN